uniref:Ribosomal protein S11 n=1 Tax=Vischeria sp. CAUP Q 202 TaxID=1805947 RepID=A0A140F2T3_9STRA|nr:ribosomal protein S11 [Vischeria punctata]AML60717.1 ribosomal protein S11 [Vischeria sp. CAUP Q 202]UUA03910.1 ribosomal protein S11 [Vischeria punctata]
MHTLKQLYHYELFLKKHPFSWCNFFKYNFSKIKYNLQKKTYRDKYNFFKKRLFHLKNEKDLLRDKNSVFLLYIKSSFNNTRVSLTNVKGELIIVKSCSLMGFKGKKRNSALAISSTLDFVLNTLKQRQIDTVFLFLNGFNQSRHFIKSSLRQADIKLLGIKDITPIPHNGCRNKKRRRV